MDLERLKKIQRVDAPPFLFTRIQQKINAQAATISPTRAWSISLVCSLLLVLNVSILLNTEEALSEKKNLLDKMHLSSNNQLYRFENEQN